MPLSEVLREVSDNLALAESSTARGRRARRAAGPCTSPTSPHRRPQPAGTRPRNGRPSTPRQRGCGRAFVRSTRLRSATGRAGSAGTSRRAAAYGGSPCSARSIGVPHRRHGCPPPLEDPVLPPPAAGRRWSPARPGPCSLAAAGAPAPRASRGRARRPPASTAMTPRRKQRLGLVEVADAGQVPLVEQGRADLAVRVGGAAGVRPRRGPSPGRAGPVRGGRPASSSRLARQQLDHGQAVADRLPVGVRQHAPGPATPARRATGRPAGRGARCRPSGSGCAG